MESAVLPVIEHLGEVASTNDLARGAAERGEIHGWAVRADVQTAGRGQRGHGWTSPTGGLYLSIVVRPGVGERLMGGATLACGVGCARALTGLEAQGVRLKWPNDLVVVDASGIRQPRKLGGILCEAGRSGEGAYVVCGIGINRTTPVVERPMPHALEAVGLDECLAGGAPLPSLEELAIAVRDGVVEVIDEWAVACAAAGESATPLTGMLDEYLGLLAYRSKQVEVFARDGSPLGTGVLLGLDAWGRAIVQHGPAEVRAIDPSEASIRPLDGCST